MRILITNNTLLHRSGSELYARDVACRLRELGHEVAAFSTQIGAVADDLVAGGVTVVDDLSRLPFRPDIIHGQHHLETLTALWYLPGVPAVYFCHGALPWEEMPPLFPRIRCYIAVDFACRERVVREAGIPEAAVRVLPNFVNLQKFAMRPPLPEKPRRALIFSNGATDENYAKAIRAACANLGVPVDTIGLLSQSPAAHPEEWLPQYDLVFAKARAALEAMAVGCAVVVCDTLGCGPMVSPDNFDALRQLNFGFRTMTQPATVENLAFQIARYDASAAAAVCQRVRAEADLRPTVDAIVQLYQEVLTSHKNSPVDADAEMRAAGEYLQWLSPVIKRALKDPNMPSLKGTRRTDPP